MDQEIRNAESAHDCTLACLIRLLPHLRGDNFAVTGSVAMRLSSDGTSTASSRDVPDLDLVAGDLNVLAESVTADFLVNHYHRPTPDHPKFMVQLVDRTLRVRVDLFPDLLECLGRAETLTVGAESVRVVRDADILDHKVRTLQRATVNRPVDPKHLEDAKALARSLKRSVPDIPLCHLARDTYSQDVYQTCRRCEESRSSAFPLAPKSEVIELLGYV